MPPTQTISTPAAAPDVPNSSRTPAATDGELLFRFAENGSEEAFGRIVERHARLVAGICRRVLRHEQDVEDAFQATFLVLVRRADRLREHDSVAAWLFTVARRIALRAADRRTRTTNGEPEPPARDGCPQDVADREEFEILASELDRLPESYRLPLVLHYLEGLSRADAADLLDCTEASVKARLARGRRMLRRRLMRRGVALSVAFAALATPATGFAGMVESATLASIHHGTGGALGIAASPGSLTLAKGLPSMSLPALKLSTIVGTTLACSLLVAGVALSQSPRGDAGRPPNAAGLDSRATVAADDAGDATDSPLDVSADPPGKRGLRDPFDQNALVDPAAPGSADAGDVPAGRKGLDTRISLQVEEATLQQALHEIVQFTGVNIVMDERGLKLLGSDANRVLGQRVSLHVDGITARTALELLLDPLDLDHTDDGEVLRVGPSKSVARMLKWSRMTVDLKPVAPKEEVIRKALTEQTEIEFVDTPLSDALDFFGDLHDVSILIEEQALDEIGVSTDAPINRVLSGVSLESALNITLGPLDLAYVVEDEVLKITSKDAAHARRDVRVYAVGPLLRAGVLEADTMAELLLREEGEGVTAVAHGNLVTITQSPLGHRRTNALVEQLKLAAEMEERANDTGTDN